MTNVIFQFLSLWFNFFHSTLTLLAQKADSKKQTNKQTKTGRINLINT